MSQPASLTSLSIAGSHPLCEEKRRDLLLGAYSDHHVRFIAYMIDNTSSFPMDATLDKTPPMTMLQDEKPRRWATIHNSLGRLLAGEPQAVRFAYQELSGFQRAYLQISISRIV